MSGKSDRSDGDMFVVNVQFRRNATWQGTIKWAGQNEEQRFRSTLELLKIMDGALAARHPEEIEETPALEREASGTKR